MSYWGSCPPGAVVYLGSCHTGAVVVPEQLSYLGSCQPGQLSLGSCLPGQFSPWQLSVHQFSSLGGTILFLRPLMPTFLNGRGGGGIGCLDFKMPKVAYGVMFWAKKDLFSETPLVGFIKILETETNYPNFSFNTFG